MMRHEPFVELYLEAKNPAYPGWDEAIEEAGDRYDVPHVSAIALAAKDHGYRVVGFFRHEDDWSVLLERHR